jgi:hypothetical protein
MVRCGVQLWGSLVFVVRFVGVHCLLVVCSLFVHCLFVGGQLFVRCLCFRYYIAIIFLFSKNAKPPTNAASASKYTIPKGVIFVK